ncbi:hydrolase 2, exosortase A system-associated [Massilia varians]|uniref:Hydrolase 2, exosortase A system-associated n=1 Tax=Massilia varians TaxID=457921 RepID=A0ABM8C139_9BURK|nr:hydrolase 2, exosortase A system-associated [Massilia varians]BDT56873.1 hydrolase 2, exosortase A system-associated [Massilia varians]
MSRATGAAPFFLPSPRGPLFALYHAPMGVCRHALLYVHPFGEEMNKSRRMAAMTARRLAASGVAVLQLDLSGCGDSHGDFADARWEAWLDDLALGRAWLHERSGMAASLWGLRLGALLALDFARRAAAPPPRLLLWQPVTSGAVYLTQFLRLRSAGDMLRAGSAQGAQTLRAALLGGTPLEVAGYTLAPQLAAAIDILDAGVMIPPASVDWFAISPGERPMSPSSERIAHVWSVGGKAGVRVAMHSVRGPAFWDSQEIVDCPALVGATVAAMAEAAHA